MLHGAEIRGVPGLHVGDADAVDETFVHLSAPGIDSPALAHRVGVDVAVEQQALAAAGAAQPADGIDAVAVDCALGSVFGGASTGLSSASSPSACIRCHEIGKLAFARRLAVAFVAHHRGEKVEAGFFVDAIEQILCGHLVSHPTGVGEASISARV